MVRLGTLSFGEILQAFVLVAHVAVQLHDLLSCALTALDLSAGCTIPLEGMVSEVG